MIVVVASWILVLLSVFAVGFSRESRLALRRDWAQIERVRAEAYARSGVALAKTVLSQTADGDWDAPGEGWSNDDAYRAVPIGSGYFSLGYRVRGESGSETLYHGWVDENAKIPLGLLSPAILDRFEGLDARARRQIAETLARPDSTRWPLSMHPGLSAEHRQLVERTTSSYTENTVNINTASEEVLFLLGIPRDAARELVNLRAGDDGRPGTADDRPFTTLEPAQEVFAELDLNSDEAAALYFLVNAGILTTRSTVFRIRCRGWAEGSSGFVEVETVLARHGAQEFEILEWSQAWIP